MHISSSVSCCNGSASLSQSTCTVSENEIYVRVSFCAYSFAAVSVQLAVSWAFQTSESALKSFLLSAKRLKNRWEKKLKMHTLQVIHFPPVNKSKICRALQQDPFEYVERMFRTMKIRRRYFAHTVLLLSIFTLFYTFVRVYCDQFQKRFYLQKCDTFIGCTKIFDLLLTFIEQCLENYGLSRYVRLTSASDAVY